MIRAVCRLPGLLRLRLGSVEPQQFTEPLLNVLGAADERDRAAAFNHDYHWGSLSMTGYVLTDESEER